MKPRRHGVGGDDRRCAWRDGTGAGTRATMPLINEGRTVMESRAIVPTRPLFIAPYVPIRALPLLDHRSGQLLWPTTTKKVFEIRQDPDNMASVL